MAESIESRFQRYCEVMQKALAHADRRQPAQWYLKGLMLPGGRKSVEPMAARVHPQDVRSAHQSMHHLVADAEWSDRALLAAVAGEVLPVLLKDDAACCWIVDDTGFPKKGEHSVGVARQYCGQLGKTDNCQVAVSLSLATEAGSLPIGYQLYLPKQWAADRARRRRAGVPEDIAFLPKGRIALAQIEAALAAGMAPGTVLADAAYGDEAQFRDRLSQWGLRYALGVKAATALWWGSHQPAPPPQASGHGRPRIRLLRDAAHQPIAVRELAHALAPRSFRRITWRRRGGPAARLALCPRAGSRRQRRPAARRGMAAHRMAAGRARTDSLLALDAARKDFLQRAGGHGQSALAHRARLLGAQAGGGAQSL